MRLRTPNYMTSENEAQDLLARMQAVCGDKLHKATIGVTLSEEQDFTKPVYVVECIYHDPLKTPIPARYVRVYDEEDYAELVKNGCVHDYHIGTTHDTRTNYSGVRIRCESCKGEHEVPYASIIQLVLERYGALSYDEIARQMAAAKAKLEAKEQQ